MAEYINNQSPVIPPDQSDDQPAYLLDALSIGSRTMDRFGGIVLGSDWQAKLVNLFKSLLIKYEIKQPEVQCNSDLSTWIRLVLHDAGVNYTPHPSYKNEPLAKRIIRII